ncbi:hypothetical protein GT045_37625 [Streptomyces sp. SID486]|nr:hypothetical protein [Streptomyces sp. SID2955]MYW44236.1 hypothetical protein [Streptomyces sp. SID161]MYY00356.1 hypothetical protein [Streptomyces sp. SID486]
MPRVGSLRSLHGPTGRDRGPFWAVRRATGTVDGCASCPLSARHDRKFWITGTGPERPRA